jgi:hypothetical protein
MAKEFLYDKASQVLDHVPPNQDGSKDVAIAIILAILQMLPVLYKCWQDRKRATARVNNPTFFDRLILRRALRNKLGSEQYRKYGPYITRGLLALGADATEGDVERFLAEAGG